MDKKNYYSFRNNNERYSKGRMTANNQGEKRIPEVTIYLEDIYESQEYLKIKESLKNLTVGEE